jgi:hypothetical protein
MFPPVHFSVEEQAPEDVILLRSCSHPTAVLLRSYSASTRVLARKTLENKANSAHANQRKFFRPAPYAGRRRRPNSLFRALASQNHLKTCQIVSRTRFPRGIPGCGKPSQCLKLRQTGAKQRQTSLKSLSFETPQG